MALKLGMQQHVVLPKKQRCQHFRDLNKSSSSENKSAPETGRCLKRNVCIVDFPIQARQGRECMMKEAPLPASP